MHQKLRRPSHATIVAYLALFVALGGTTYAATGGNFILGQSNTASSTTSLSSSGSGPALKATNTSTGTAGSFNTEFGRPPITVNQDTKITNLNADKLDGKDSTAFLNKCPSPATARYGRICAGSDGALRNFKDALSYCAGLGLHLPSVSEAVTLAKNHDVPGVATDGSFWTDDWFYFPDPDPGRRRAAAKVDEDGNHFIEVDYAVGVTVCVTDPTNN